MGATNLRLVVENLGPIEHADVELKPLTVLIGKNNTGKTYLAQALYATHKAVKPYGLSDALDDDEIDILLRASQNTSEDPLELPPEVEPKVTNWINSALAYSGNELQNNLRGYFGVPDLGDITRWDQQAEVMVELHNDRINNRINKSRTCLFRNTKNEELSPLKAPKDVLKFDTQTIPYKSILWQINENEEDKRMRNSEVSYFITRTVWDEFLNHMGLNGTAHYLPAGRSGLLNAWTDVVKLRFELERERFGLSRVPDSSLGGVAFDFISSLASIIGPRRPHYYLRFRRENTFDATGPQVLLQKLMGGKIRAGSAEEMVPTLEYQQDGHKIAVHRASSMVADLAPLAMWMEHLVSPNDLLIIDEPESHLHPEAIRLVAQVLVGLVNQGVKVVCATHSSVLLHELSNCILRGQLKHKHNDHSENYPDTEQIAIDDIAVYRFQQSQPTGPVRVAQETIEPDWGIHEDEYLDVASKLSDDTADLIDQLT